MPNNAFSLTDVSQAFAEPHHRPLHVLHNITLAVRPGEFVSLVGPSGCGKSTLVRIMAGLIKPTSGQVSCNVEKLAIVFQNLALFPWLTVTQNIEFGLEMQGIGKAERAKIAKEKINEVGLTGFEHRYPKELSGGMKQRVGIARALAIKPDAIILDEPFSSLDSFTADILKKELFSLWQKYKMTVVMVTHLVEDALELSDKIVLISKRPGEIIDEIKIDWPYPRHPRDPKFYDLVDTIKQKITATAVLNE